MMNAKTYTKRWPVLVVLVCVVGLGFPLLVSAEQGMASANYRIAWSALNTGGATMASGSLQMQGTVSQSPTGLAASEHYRVNAGYWPGWFALTGRSVTAIRIRSFDTIRVYEYWIIGALFLLWFVIAILWRWPSVRQKL